LDTLRIPPNDLQLGKHNGHGLYLSLFPFGCVMRIIVATNNKHSESRRLALARAYAKEVGLSVDWNNPHSTLSPLAWVTQCSREFDFGSAPDFPQFHYAGPFHDGRGRMDFDFPWQQFTGEPIVYASMGTLQNGLIDIFRSITQAAIRLKELQFVLAVGGQLDPKQFGDVPANVMVVSYAPQIEILKRSSLCITRAG
jgi:zeaxanthin glucosyltransferase